MYTESHTIRITRSSGVAKSASRPHHPFVTRFRRLLIGPPATHVIRAQKQDAVSEVQCRAMVPVIRSLLKSEGKVRARQDGLDWSSDLDIVRVHVAVTQHVTHVEISGDARLDLIASFVAPALFLVLPAAGLGIAADMGWGIATMVLVPAAWLVGRVAWQVVGSRFQRKLQKLAQHLIEQSGGGPRST